MLWLLAPLFYRSDMTQHGKKVFRGADLDTAQLNSPTHPAILESDPMRQSASYTSTSTIPEEFASPLATKL